jgi:hypothetical protein
VGIVQSSINGAGDSQPDVSGDRVVWVTESLGGQDVVAADLSLQFHDLIYDSQGSGNDSTPDIEGSLVVWDSEIIQPGLVPSNIEQVNLDTLVETTLAVGGASANHYLGTVGQLGGAWVTRFNPGQLDSTDDVIDTYGRITYDGQTKSALSASPNGRYLVWEQPVEDPDGPDDREILAYDVDHGVVFAVTDNTAWDHSPRVTDDGWFAWTRDQDGDAEIILSDGLFELPLTNNNVADYLGDIDGQWVVWSQYNDAYNNFEIVVYDIDAMSQEVISISPYHDDTPRTDGTTIVWAGFDPVWNESVIYWARYVPEPASVVILVLAGPILLAGRRGAAAGR